MAAVSMTEQTQAAVLRVFLDHPDQEHYGLEIAEAAGLKPGSIYAELAWLERVGWVASGWEQVGAGSRRRYYKLTSVGAAAANQSPPGSSR
jgi:DNA-binding PadR family transcriptional regulator